MTLIDNPFGLDDSQPYRVMSVGDPLEWTRFREFVDGLMPAAHRPNYYVLDRVLALVEDAGCKTVIWEFPYEDADHRRAHRRLRGRSYMDFSRYAARLHFFTRACTDPDVALFVEDPNEYLGMCVLRPVSACPVGRTILAEKVAKPPVDSWRGYITCSTNHEVHIAGRRIPIRGPAFIQQDHEVSACATAAIWTAQWHMSGTYREFQRFHTPEITAHATHFDVSTGRPVPSGGLTNEQVLQALRGMGYDPYLQFLLGLNAANASARVYKVVESGIPVLLFLQWFEEGSLLGHLVTVVGHALSPTVPSPSIGVSSGEPGDGTLMIAETANQVPGFLYHDDAVGPYEWLVFRDIDKLSWPDLKAMHRSLREGLRHRKLLKEQGITVVAVFLDDTGRATRMSGTDLMAAPFPPAVSLAPQEAISKAIAVFYTMDPDVSDPEILLRPYLTPSEDYKASMLERLGSSNELVKRVTEFAMPRWVWVVEFLEGKVGPGRDPMTVGTVIIDGSSSRDTYDCILAHKKGWFLPVPRVCKDVIGLINNLRDAGPELLPGTFVPYARMERGCLTGASQSP